MFRIILLEGTVKFLTSPTIYFNYSPYENENQINNSLGSYVRECAPLRRFLI